MAEEVDWVTSAEVKTVLEISGGGRDAAIAAAITAASRALNRRIGRELTPRTDDATRTFAIQPQLCTENDGAIVPLRPHDLRAITTATLHPGEGSATDLVADRDYALWPLGPSPLTGTWTKLKLARAVWGLGSTFQSAFGVAKLQIRGSWGAWATSSVPEDIKRACIVTVGSWIDKAIAEYGDRSGDEPRVMQRSVFEGYAIPRSALTLLSAAGLGSFPVLR